MVKNGWAEILAMWLFNRNVTNWLKPAEANISGPVGFVWVFRRAFLQGGRKDGEIGKIKSVR